MAFLMGGKASVVGRMRRGRMRWRMEAAIIIIVVESCWWE